MRPDFQTIMLPFLKAIADGSEHTLQEVILKMVEIFKLTEEDLNIRLEGGQPLLHNRVGWARTYLLKAGLIESPRRAVFKITPTGALESKSNIDRITIRHLRKFPAFQQWMGSFNTPNSADESTSENLGNAINIPEQTPEELLQDAFSNIKKRLKIDLLDRISNLTPAQFENLVVKLIIRMGYGFSKEEGGKVVGNPNDGGIDGIIQQDKLGLEFIYIQAKKWAGNVGIGAVRDFAGALLQHKAKKGIMITSSDFPPSAYDFTNNLELKIILINGERLAGLMIDHNIGVQTEISYEIKRQDNDFFEEL